MLLTTLRCLRRPPTLPSTLPLAARRAMSQYTLSTYLVTPAELNSALKKNVHSKLSTAPKIVPLCASWFLPNDGRDGKETCMWSRYLRRGTG